MAGVPKWNVSSPRAYGRDNEKTFWVNVGSAWENDSDKGKHDVVIEFSALPLPDADGKVRVFLFPKDDAAKGDREESFGRKAGKAASKGSRSGRASGSRTTTDLDDEIPF